jgi:hypothetical protein
MLGEVGPGTLLLMAGGDGKAFKIDPVAAEVKVTTEEEGLLLTDGGAGKALRSEFLGEALRGASEGMSELLLEVGRAGKALREGPLVGLWLSEAKADRAASDVALTVSVGIFVGGGGAFFGKAKRDLWGGSVWAKFALSIEPQSAWIAIILFFTGTEVKKQ